MKYKVLNRVDKPEDIQNMDYRELEFLCSDIRSFLIEKVSQTGGHLSSNLGMIELTVAMHRFLHTPVDKILFDVGHQSYTHKILTGRKDSFDGLRSFGGISGFPNPRESGHDAFLAGHGSAALSAAIGIARAKKLKREEGLVVVVIGDGAFTGGMIYEGINNIGSLDNLVVVLNDNKMSISKNTGALAHYLNSLRTSPQYYKTKNDVKNLLNSTPVIGDGVMKGIQSFKSSLRKSLYHSTFFEEMGMRYVGPIDGHDLPGLCAVFSNIRQLRKPLILHVETQKGRGFTPAERNPGAYHGVSAFDAQKINEPDNIPGKQFSTVFGRTLTKLADSNPKICAVTAAMKYGTGLQFFKKGHGERFFDVGMAEEHAVTFAGGLAAGGMLPVVAIYSTFLQRAYDQIIHDVVLGENNVLFAIDRAGLVPGDGETHQGIYDAAYLSQQPDLTIVSPCNYQELVYWTEELLENRRGPRAIRYPRGTQAEVLADKECTGQEYDLVREQPDAQCLLVSYGGEMAEALVAADHLKDQGQRVDVLQLVVINPLSEELMQKIMEYPLIFFAEEGVRQGGIGEHVACKLLEKGYTGRYHLQAVESNRLPHSDIGNLLKLNKLNAGSLVDWIADVLKQD